MHEVQSWDGDIIIYVNICWGRFPQLCQISSMVLPRKQLGHVHEVISSRIQFKVDLLFITYCEYREAFGWLLLETRRRVKWTLVWSSKANYMLLRAVWQDSQMDNYVRTNTKKAPFPGTGRYHWDASLWILMPPGW